LAVAINNLAVWIVVAQRRVCEAPAGRAFTINSLICHNSANHS
jgi:hypothetical protein